MRPSEKQLQSECGATGDAGPNLLFASGIAHEIRDNFESDPKGPTCKDACLYISQTLAGHEWGTDNPVLNLSYCIQGSTEQQISLMTELIIHNPVMRNIMAAAIINSGLYWEKFGFEDAGESDT